MNKTLLGATIAMAFAPVAANATITHVYGPTLAPVYSPFTVTSDDPMGTYVTAVLGDGFTSTEVKNFGTSFDTTFEFYVSADGIGSGSFSTSSSSPGTKLTFSSVFIDGVDLSSYLNATKTGFEIDSVPLFAFPYLNTIEVKGTVGKLGGSFGGNATYIASVPEATTWAMMIGGVGILGAALRRRQGLTVRYA